MVVLVAVLIEHVILVVLIVLSPLRTHDPPLDTLMPLHVILLTIPYHMGVNT